MQSENIILGFETSCDETAIALMKGDNPVSYTHLRAHET
mgnify:CR=1 FL=1